MKLTNTQLSKSNSAAKNKTGTTLRITMKKFKEEESPHELFLTAGQKFKIRKAFINNMSAEIKLSKSQLTKMIQSGVFLSKTLGNVMRNLRKEALIDLLVPMVKIFCLN